MKILEKDTNGCGLQTIGRRYDGQLRSWQSYDLRQSIVAAGVIFGQSPHGGAAVSHE
jgi:hypothetical protein